MWMCCFPSWTPIATNDYVGERLPAIAAAFPVEFGVIFILQLVFLNAVYKICGK